MPPFLEQLKAVETFLGRSLPAPVAALFAPGAATARHLLPLATGREHEAFEDDEEQFASVLGDAMGRREDAEVFEDVVWPPGLLVIEDVGCAVFRAVDLDHPRLRVIQYDHLQPVDDPEQAACGFPLAYGEPDVPRLIQHRFLVIADSLEDWVQMARQREEERRRAREEPKGEHDGDPPRLACRVCGHVGDDKAYCPECLADTMEPVP